MQALGLIETKGLIAAIESADAMLKAAEVSLLDKTYVGGGLVSVAVTGDVGAVKAAVEAGAAAVNHLNSTLLVSQHVIPRPHQDLEDVIISAAPLRKAEAMVVSEIIEAVDLTEEVQVKEIKPAVVKTIKPVVEKFEKIAVYVNEAVTEVPEELHKAAIDKIVQKNGLEQAIAVLEKVKVVKLRNLAREYKDFGITGRLVSKADKQMIISEFRQYYGLKK
jgi:microcompartment protein CcmL/EutN